MFRYVVPILLLGTVAASAASQSFVLNPTLTDVQRYDDCLALVKVDANTAYEQALAWHDAGGGPAAEHCAALALIELKDYPEAAFKLDQLAHERDAGGADMRAEILDQAGNAWLLAGRAQDALNSFAAAINLGANDADMLADRARAKAMMKDWKGAEADLTAALGKDQYRADLLVLRASARHALGERAQALADLNQALDIDPHYVDALVERGAMKLEAGDKNGARSDWSLALATQPNGPAADTARNEIQALELSGTKPLPAKKPPQSSKH